MNCILPKEWNGVHYGGLERLVMFIDLDCRFDVTRLSEMLKHRIMEPIGNCSYGFILLQSLTKNTTFQLMLLKYFVFYYVLF